MIPETSIFPAKLLQPEENPFHHNTYPYIFRTLCAPHWIQGMRHSPLIIPAGNLTGWILCKQFKSRSFFMNAIFTGSELEGKSSMVRRPYFYI